MSVLSLHTARAPRPPRQRQGTLTSRAVKGAGDECAVITHSQGTTTSTSKQVTHTYHAVKGAGDECVIIKHSQGINALRVSREPADAILQQ